VFVGLTSVSIAAAESRNPVANPSFESPLRALVTLCSVAPRLSVGAWRPYTQDRDYAPATVTETEHAGRHSVNVQEAALGECAALAVYQDLAKRALPTNQSFTLSVWVKPEQGTQTQEVIFGWRQRPTDAPVFAVTEDMAHHTIAVGAWG